MGLGTIVIDIQGAAVATLLGALEIGYDIVVKGSLRYLTGDAQNCFIFLVVWL